MKKLLFAVVMGILVLVAAGCDLKKEKYPEEKKTLEELIRITKLFIRELDRNNNRIAIDRIVVQYTGDIKKAKPDLGKLEKLCPDYLMISGYKKAPQQLRPLFKKFYEAQVQVKLISEGKMAKFSQDKNLIKTFAELKAVLYYY